MIIKRKAVQDGIALGIIYNVKTKDLSFVSVVSQRDLLHCISERCVSMYYNEYENKRRARISLNIYNVQQCDYEAIIDIINEEIVSTVITTNLCGIIN